jgi:hypothetical protein
MNRSDKKICFFTKMDQDSVSLQLQSELDQQRVSWAQRILGFSALAGIIFVIVLFAVPNLACHLFNINCKWDGAPTQPPDWLLCPPDKVNVCTADNNISCAQGRQIKGVNKCTVLKQFAPINEASGSAALIKFENVGTCDVGVVEHAYGCVDPKKIGETSTGSGNQPAICDQDAVTKPTTGKPDVFKEQCPGSYSDDGACCKHGLCYAPTDQGEETYVEGKCLPYYDSDAASCTKGCCPKEQIDADGRCCPYLVQSQSRLCLAVSDCPVSKSWLSDTTRSQKYRLSTEATSTGAQHTAAETSDMITCSPGADVDQQYIDQLYANRFPSASAKDPKSADYITLVCPTRPPSDRDSATQYVHLTAGKMPQPGESWPYFTMSDGVDDKSFPPKCVATAHKHVESATGASIQAFYPAPRNNVFLCGKRNATNGNIEVSTNSAGNWRAEESSQSSDANMNELTFTLHTKKTGQTLTADDCLHAMQSISKSAVSVNASDLVSGWGDTTPAPPAQKGGVGGAYTGVQLKPHVAQVAAKHVSTSDGGDGDATQCTAQMWCPAVEYTVDLAKKDCAQGESCQTVGNTRLTWNGANQVKQMHDEIYSKHYQIQATGAQGGMVHALVDRSTTYPEGNSLCGLNSGGFGKKDNSCPAGKTLSDGMEAPFKKAGFAAGDFATNCTETNVTKPDGTVVQDCDQTAAKNGVVMLQNGLYCSSPSTYSFGDECCAENKC